MSEYVQLSWQMSALFLALVLYILIFVHLIKVIDYFFPKED